jgi:hypothetical protein
MPLAFESRSHGRIAFGFFNIETDLLLLENLFFFADDFCALVEEMAANSPFSGALNGWIIRDPDKIGDLHGAIGGYHLSGFIGRVYELFPFPTDPAGFKQQPEGDQNRGLVEPLLAEWAEPEAIAVSAPGPDSELALGSFRFSPAQFGRLVEYVWLGGMPRWRDGLRPEYVERLGQALERGGSGLFGHPEQT